MDVILVVTTAENIDEKNGTLIDPNLKGYIVKSETLTEPVFDEDNQPLGSTFRAICQVAWVGKAPNQTAIKVYESSALVLLGVENSISDIVSEITDLQNRLSSLEALIDDEDDDDEDDDDDVDLNDEGEYGDAPAHQVIPIR